MKELPFDIGTLHIIGIGGIGMSGIAEILHNLGHKVQGSDINESANVKRLRKDNIPVFIGHNEKNIENADAVIASSAIQEDNPEIIAARKKFIPVIPRAEMLAELMRLKWSIAISGTHGKTTTTSITSWLLNYAGIDPTIINGGIINAFGSNAVLGQGKWMVVEADESDGSFLKLPAVIGVVTNIDPEHLDYYEDYETLKASFEIFVKNIPFYGFAVLCVDHAEVQAMIPRISDRTLITYGFNPQADVRAVNIRPQGIGMVFDVEISERVNKEATVISDIYLPMVGEHNVQNSLAAISIALKLEITPEVIKKGLSQFTGVKRRFTHVGDVDGITIIDDYGHHPVEISSVLKAARKSTSNKIIAVFQPHRYSRVEELFEEFCTCFNDADHVIVTDIYAAGEEPIEGISQETLIQGLIERGHRSVAPLENPEDLEKAIKEKAETGDYVICLGAGSISDWAYTLYDQMKLNETNPPKQKNERLALV